MVELVGAARFDDAEVIGNRSEGGEGGAEGGLGFAVLFELKLRAEDGGVGLDKGVALVADDGGGEGGAFELGEVGLGVEELELTRGPGHEEVDDGFGLWFDLGKFWFEGASLQGVGEEGGGGDFSKAEGAFAEEVAAGERGCGHG